MQICKGNLYVDVKAYRVNTSNSPFLYYKNVCWHHTVKRIKRRSTQMFWNSCLHSSISWLYFCEKRWVSKTINTAFLDNSYFVLSRPRSYYSPTRNGGETKMTPSPLTNSIGMLLFVVCWRKTRTELVNKFSFHCSRDTCDNKQKIYKNLQKTCTFLYNKNIFSWAPNAKSQMLNA